MWRDRERERERERERRWERDLLVTLGTGYTVSTAKIGSSGAVGITVCCTITLGCKKRTICINLKLLAVLISIKCSP